MLELVILVFVAFCSGGGLGDNFLLSISLVAGIPLVDGGTAACGNADGGTGPEAFLLEEVVSGTAPVLDCTLAELLVAEVGGCG